MKQVPQINSREAAALVKEGDTIFGGGFGMTGNPFIYFMPWRNEVQKI
jgi:3-oxoacid CoA-transferase